VAGWEDASNQCHEAIIFSERGTGRAAPLLTLYLPAPSFTHKLSGGAHFLEDNVPAMHTLGENHDQLVDYLTDRGVPDWLANIPTMPPAYVYSVGEELLNSGKDLLDWLFPDPPPPCVGRKC